MSNKHLLNFTDFFKALSNPNRIEIIEIFIESNESLTLKEIYSKINEKHTGKKIYRETVFKNLEKLVAGGIIGKDSANHKVYYFLALNRIIIDLNSLTLNFELNEGD